MHHRSRWFLTLALCGLAAPASAQIIYVDDTAAGSNDGASWCDAFVYLQDALAAASSDADVTEIRVAQGTYRPDHGAGQTPGDRNATFTLIDGLALRGGYAGCGAADPEARDFALQETVLRNGYHVVTGNGLGGSTLLEGLTITGGFQWSTDLSGNVRGGGLLISDSFLAVQDCTIRQNMSERGGGAFVDGGTISFTRCRFQLNKGDSDTGAAGKGGAVYLEDTSASFTSCQFLGNEVSHIIGASGGAMYIEDGNTLITDCVFASNWASGEGNGGAIFNASQSLTIRDSRFSTNYVSGNGGEGGAVFGGDAIIANSTFENNTAPLSGSGGGAILAHSLVLEDCRFVRNSSYATYFGGAVSATSVKATRSLFRENYSRWFGGAIYSVAPAELVDCTFENNRARYGGAVNAAGYIVGCTFFNNEAEESGGAIEGNGVTAVNCSFYGNSAAESYGTGGGGFYGSGQFFNCTFVNNRASYQFSKGGGVHLAGKTVILNSILWHNTDSHGNAESAQIAFNITPPDVTYSVIEGLDFFADGIGNLGSDPLLTDELRLMPGSPAINAGDPDSKDLPPTDLAGHPRVLCGRVDMGAYEFGMGDYDCNQTVDLVDFAHWGWCVTGPKTTADTAVAHTCVAFDFNADGDVDLQDFAGLQAGLQQ